MMKLIDLGFDPWFEAHVDAIRHENQGIARVSAVDRNSYIIRNELREIPAELAGKFYFHVESSFELPCVGDWVTVQYHNDDTSAIIHGVFPRRTFLRRKRAGVEVDYQMIAANIDIAFIIQSCHFDFNLPRMNHCCPIKIALPVMVHPERLAIVLVSGSRYQSVPSGQRVFHG